MADAIRPLGKREMEVYLCLVRDLKSTAELFAAKLRAIEIIAANPIDKAAQAALDFYRDESTGPHNRRHDD